MTNKPNHFRNNSIDFMTHYLIPYKGLIITRKLNKNKLRDVNKIIQKKKSRLMQQADFLDNTANNYFNFVQCFLICTDFFQANKLHDMYIQRPRLQWYLFI